MSLAACAGSSPAMPPSTSSFAAAGAKETVKIKQFADLPQYADYYGPAGITLGPDKALWITDDIDQDFGESAVVRVLPNGQQAKIYYYQGLSTEGSSLGGIATGPDGNLWVTDSYNSQILRLTPSGTYTGYRTNISPYEITLGPDHALWFTTYSEVGRITTSGKITTYGVGDGAYGIAAGPDKALWFTETFTNAIGRITTHGKYVAYSNGISTGALPNAIAAGPDGALWFTEPGAGKIGRITTSGTVTEYSKGITPTEEPTGIAAGPDGAMWFTEYETYDSYEIRDSKIGRIAMNGKVTEYSQISSTSAPGAIVKGDNDELWFVESYADETGRIKL
ncbi:MAG TPA: hypothetical protein VGX91_12520 [Candidatus Cybelea sp.]|jgi:virginiamycin B lyase|nr:hypothetical protein [Candidatus Cybelea sp.]